MGLILLLPVRAETVSRETKPEPQVTFDDLVDSLATKYGQSASLARAIINCEGISGQNHPNYDKEGNHWSTDIGYWQVNDYYHKEAARQLGFNIYNWKDNLEYGFLLMKNEGLKPWQASRNCWSKKAS